MSMTKLQILVTNVNIVVQVVSSARATLPLLTITKRISIIDIDAETNPRNVFTSDAIEYQLVDDEDDN